MVIGAILAFTISFCRIWEPDILMSNSASSSFNNAFPTNVIVHSDGRLEWIPPGIFSSTCQVSWDLIYDIHQMHISFLSLFFQIDITWFPFDDQACKLKFGSWTNNGKRLNLTLLNPTGLLATYQINGVSSSFQRIVT